MAEKPDPDDFDPFFDPLPGEGPESPDHPNNVQDWHPGRDFLDPLADEVGEWSQKAWDNGASDPRGALRDLSYSLIAIAEGIGSDIARRAWARTRAWFDVHMHGEFKDRLAEAVHTVWNEMEACERRIARLPPHAEDELKAFILEGVEPFLEKLRDWSRELKRKFPPPLAPPRGSDEVSPACLSDQNPAVGQTRSAEAKAESGRKPRKRGRKRLAAQESKHRLKILSDWKRAKSAGTSAKTFCRQYDPPLSSKELERIVSWKAARDRRSRPA